MVKQAKLGFNVNKSREMASSEESGDGLEDTLRSNENSAGIEDINDMDGIGDYKSPHESHKDDVDGTDVGIGEILSRSGDAS
jgi:hypothetical protein